MATLHLAFGSHFEGKRPVEPKVTERFNHLVRLIGPEVGSVFLELPIGSKLAHENQNLREYVAQEKKRHEERLAAFATGLSRGEVLFMEVWGDHSGQPTDERHFYHTIAGENKRRLAAGEKELAVFPEKWDEEVALQMYHSRKLESDAMKLRESNPEQATELMARAFLDSSRATKRRNENFVESVLGEFERNPCKDIVLEAGSGHAAVAKLLKGKLPESSTIDLWLLNRDENHPKNLVVEALHEKPESTDAELMEKFGEALRELAKVVLDIKT
jgi:hypothetical protein